MLSKAALSIAAAGLCFIGYCIYFDRKRRSDPQFKEKLREKRKKAKQSLKKHHRPLRVDLCDPESVQRFFLEEIHLGQDFLTKGDVEGCVEHFGNAIVVCGRPQEILMALRQTVPPSVFQQLIQELPHAEERVATVVHSAGI